MLSDEKVFKRYSKHDATLEWHMEITRNRVYRLCLANIRLNAIDGCRGVSLTLAIPYLFYFYLEVMHPVLRGRLPTKRTKSYTKDRDFWDMPIEKVIGISYSDRLRISLWETAGSWSRSQPWWWEISFPTLTDVVLGRERYSFDYLDEGYAQMQMPEGEYTVKWTQKLQHWKRPRWPWGKQHTNFGLNFDPPLPIPGKAVWSRGSGALTIEGAIDETRRDILKRRTRCGGKNWKPAEGWPKEAQQ